MIDTIKGTCILRVFLKARMKKNIHTYFLTGTRYDGPVYVSRDREPATVCLWSGTKCQIEVY
jgi:hypothetical protein